MTDQTEFLKAWFAHVDEAATTTARSAFLAHLADRSETSFWALPEDVQADVVAIGCDLCDAKRDAFAAAIESGPHTLGEVWRYAAQRYQRQVDDLLLNASREVGRA